MGIGITIVGLEMARKNCAEKQVMADSSTENCWNIVPLILPEGGFYPGQFSAAGRISTDHFKFKNDERIFLKI